MASKKDVEKELIFCQAKIELLEKQLETSEAEKEGLRDQILKLQDAMISIRAPEAYQDMRIREFEANQEPVSEEEKQRTKEIEDLQTRYLNECEGPLFKSGEDIDDLLRSGLIQTMGSPPSLHGNDES